MPTTRSSTKQTHLDDSKELKAPIKTNKRKADQKDDQPKKSAKSSKIDVKHDTNSAGDVVIINRAPVLELWAASVTSFLYPKLSRETCLSVGGAISTLCAISKGRAIGAIDKPDPDKAKDRREKRQSEQHDEIEVMHFTLPMKDDVAVVGGKPKKSNESALKHKFGEQFDKVQKVFEDSLATWKGDENDLNGQAFHMYEKFRPTVPAGQKGWGRQGQLSLDKAADIIRKS